MDVQPDGAAGWYGQVQADSFVFPFLCTAFPLRLLPCLSHSLSPSSVETVPSLPSERLFLLGFQALCGRVVPIGRWVHHGVSLWHRECRTYSLHPFRVQHGKPGHSQVVLIMCEVVVENVSEGDTTMIKSSVPLPGGWFFSGLYQ